MQNAYRPGQSELRLPQNEHLSFYAPQVCKSGSRRQTGAVHDCVVRVVDQRRRIRIGLELNGHAQPLEARREAEEGEPRVKMPLIGEIERSIKATCEIRFERRNAIAVKPSKALGALREAVQFPLIASVCHDKATAQHRTVEVLTPPRQALDPK
jgi:hypothetical protein